MPVLNNLKIGTRLAICFGLLLALMLSVSVMSALRLDATARTIAEATRIRQDQLAPPAPAPPTPAAGKRYKVLVVDDDPSLLRLYELEMGGWGLPLDIIKAGDGFDALLKIGRHQPDLLISDLNMPGMDGFRMVSTLRADPLRKHLRIIVISGLDGNTIAALGLPDDIPVFGKPVQFAGLHAKVKQLLSFSNDGTQRHR